MKINELLTVDTIQLHANVSTKKEAIEALVELHNKAGRLSDKEAFKEAIYNREKLSSTGIGDNIAIPHAQSRVVNSPGLAVIVVDEGVDYNSLDGKAAKLFFMIAVPEGGGSTHLEILATLCQILMEDKVRSSLLQATSPQKFLSRLENAMNEEVKEEKSDEEDYDVLAVTACPTGIAHTYMAAKALEEKAKLLGYKIKVETNGSSGIKNKLTKEEIERTKCIIVAADRQVEMARFNGKPVIQCPVAKGIHEAEKLLQQAMHQEPPIYYNENKDDKSEQEKVGVVRTLYKHLMSGVSQIIPILVIGGVLYSILRLFATLDGFTLFTNEIPWMSAILSVTLSLSAALLSGYIASSIGEQPAFGIGCLCGLYAYSMGAGFIGCVVTGFVCGYILFLIRKSLSYLPDVLESIKPTVLYPVLGILVAGILTKIFICTSYNGMGFSNLNIGIINGLTNMNMTIKIILGFILGMMMSVDMGGPVNKTAYTIGIFSIFINQGDIMAAVMMGGMVPPLIVGLSTTIFKSRFSQEQRKSGLRNYWMAASFVTEEAIPFMVSDKKSIYPACLIGSGIAGAISIYGQCNSLVPHGGLFLLSCIQEPFWYLGALVIGALVGTIIVGLVKKKTTIVV